MIGLISIILAILYYLSRSIFALDKAIVSSIIAGFVAVTIALIAYWREQSKARKEAHRSSKIEIYSHFFDIIFDMLEKVKHGEDLSHYAESDEVQQKLFKLKKGALFYGSPKVINAIGNWSRTANDNIGPKATMQNIGLVLLAMREDIGLSNSGLNSLSIHQIYITDDVYKIENMKVSS